MLRIINKVLEVETNGLKVCRIKDEDLILIKQKEENPNLKLYVNDYLVNDIIAYGDINESTGKELTLKQLLKHKIPHVLQKHNGEFKKSYHCYAGYVGTKNNLIIHEDPLSSVNCLISVLGNPKLVLLFD